MEDRRHEEDAVAARQQDGAGTVGVVGARGGAGATVLAALLAARLARKGATALVDGGPGPSIDTVLGLESHPGLRWPGLSGARGVVDPALLAGNLMRWDRCAVLPADDSQPGPPRPDVVPDVLDALTVAHRSVVVDLDRSGLLREDPTGARVLADACATVLVLAPRDVTGVAGARLLRDVLVRDGRRVGLVAGGAAPAVLAPEEVAAAVGLPVVGALPRAR
ncbi:hypothetical protein EBM89_20345, partial [Cellulomonas triticagri]